MCLSPIYKRGRLSDNSDARHVPCGYCCECVRRKKLDWQIRLDAARAWADCSFFRLLTYDPEHYNFDIYDKNVIKDHLQRFMKRLRRRLEYHFGSHIRIKYFIASEYGETYDRLHYHALFFVKGAKFTWLEMKTIINSCWPYGIVGNTYNINPGRIAYCVKYIQKQYNTKLFSKFEMRKIAPFLEYDVHMTRRHDVDDINNLPHYVLNGKRVSLPYYWMHQLFTNNECIRYRSTIQNYNDSISEVVARKNHDDCRSRQSQFEYENAIGFKFNDFRFEKYDDITPNYYESNI